MDGIDVGGLLFWALLWWALDRAPRVQIVRQRRSWRDMFHRTRTDP